MLSPWLFVSVLLQAWKNRSGRFTVQRFGFKYPKPDSPSVWIHCASVGEVTAVKPLVTRLIDNLPGCKVVISTTTSTGADNVLSWNLDDVVHQFLPVDFQFCVQRMIRSVRPVILIVMETEIWPNLFNSCVTRDIPVVMVNGRLSDKTLKSPQWLRDVLKQALAGTSGIFAKSEMDKQGFLELGADPAKVQVIGNIKFAAQPGDYGGACDIDKPFWLLASTHKDEELQLCSILSEFSECAKRLLIIAPRHPERGAEIYASLKSIGLSIAVRSKSDLVSADTDVYLADRLGEMAMWLSKADVVFMGGSLVPVGGHNLLEPAMAGVPIVSGSHLHNFHEEADLLLSAGAMVQCDNASQVLGVVNDLLNEPDRREAMIRAGKNALTDYCDVADRYVEAVLPFIAIDK